MIDFASAQAAAYPFLARYFDREEEVDWIAAYLEWMSM